MWKQISAAGRVRNESNVWTGTARRLNDVFDTFDLLSECKLCTSWWAVGPGSVWKACMYVRACNDNDLFLKVFTLVLLREARRVERGLSCAVPPPVWVNPGRAALCAWSRSSARAPFPVLGRVPALRGQLVTYAGSNGELKRRALSPNASKGCENISANTLKMWGMIIFFFSHPICSSVWAPQVAHSGFGTGARDLHPKSNLFRCC